MMKIIICGAGLSGRAIAEKLSEIGNEVTVIDSSKRLVEKIGNKLDVRGIVGHGAHPDVLGDESPALASRNQRNRKEQPAPSICRSRRRSLRDGVRPSWLAR